LAAATVVGAACAVILEGVAETAALVTLGADIASEALSDKWDTGTLVLDGVGVATGGLGLVARLPKVAGLFPKTADVLDMMGPGLDFFGGGLGSGATARSIKDQIEKDCDK
jgi:hypothetical protein